MTQESIIGRSKEILKSEGIIVFLKKLILYPLSFKRRKEYREMLELTSTKEKFANIYANHLWEGESLSGTGSGLEHTKNLRDKLPKLVESYEINSIVDAPCGDFHWMRHVLPSLNVNYIGCDIVDAVVKDNNLKYSSERSKFLVVDITQDSIPQGDLMIVRDCLFHLCYQDIEKFLKNLQRSSIKYLLTTTHINCSPTNFQNSDIKSGDFRLINIFSTPFLFNPEKVLMEIDDWVRPDQERKMVLIKKEDVPDCLSL